ncbi:MAG: ABC transporter ATP-binding protein [Patescibacteria group bacterium]
MTTPNNQNNTIKTTKTPLRGPMGHGGPGGMMMPGQKPKNFKKTLRQLITYLKPFKLAITVVFVFTIASTVFAIVSPKILGQMTNQVVNDFVKRSAYDQVLEHLPTGITLPLNTTGEQLIKQLPDTVSKQIPASMQETLRDMNFSSRPEFDYNKLLSFAITLLILYGLSAIFSYIQGWIMAEVAQKATYSFRHDIAEKIGKLPLRYFDGQSHGEVLSRITNDVDTVGQTLNQSLTQILSSITLIIGMVAMMFSINWHMTLVALITIPLSFGLLILIVKKSQKYFAEQQKILGNLNGHVEEMYGGHMIMKVYNGQDRSLATFNKYNKKLYGCAWKSQFLSGLMFPIINFVGNLGFVGVTVVGGWLAVNGRVNIGDIQAFIQYVNRFNQPVMQTANIANVLQSTTAAAERVFAFLEEAEEIPEAKQPNLISQVRGSVEFKHVTFGYEPDKLIIHDFNVNIMPGQRVAIVGPTGAGKTTMVNLLMRFYDVNSGKILVDGIDIKSLKRSHLRQLFGMVLQDTWLFNGTLRDNIAYGRPDATEADIMQAAKAAHVDHFVRSLPKGYDMVLVEEVSNISQGEKQLLTIARAMLINAPILILDEATSSVDTRTEILIQKAMGQLMKNKTSFVIAHRLSTIKNADLILVMDQGNIVEQGKHADLLEKNGFYASLYNSQFTGPLTA